MLCKHIFQKHTVYITVEPVFWKLRSTEHTIKPTKTPEEFNIRHHTVCDNNKRRDHYQDEGHKTQQKKHRNTRQKVRNRSLQQDQNYISLIPNYNIQKLKTHHRIKTAILRLNRL
jgi:hypothetical protein